MQLTEPIINTQNPTLDTLLLELKDECAKVMTLIHQLQLADLSDRQRGDILAELLVSSIYLETHRDQDLQNLISNIIEQLPDEEV